MLRMTLELGVNAKGSTSLPSPSSFSINFDQVISRAQYPHTKSRYITMSDTKFWFREPIFQFSIWKFETLVEVRLRRHLSVHYFLSFFFFHFSPIFRPKYRLDIYWNRLDPPHQHFFFSKVHAWRVVLYDKVSPHQYFRSKFAKLNPERAFEWGVLVLAGPQLVLLFNTSTYTKILGTRYQVPGI